MSRDRLKQEVVTQIQRWLSDLMEKYRLKCIVSRVAESDDDDGMITEWTLEQRQPKERFRITTDDIFEGLQDKDYG